MAGRQDSLLGGESLAQAMEEDRGMLWVPGRWAAGGAGSLCRELGAPPAPPAPCSAEQEGVEESPLASPLGQAGGSVLQTSLSTVGKEEQLAVSFLSDLLNLRRFRDIQEKNPRHSLCICIVATGTRVCPLHSSLVPRATLVTFCLLSRVHLSICFLLTAHLLHFIVSCLKLKPCDFTLVERFEKNPHPAHPGAFSRVALARSPCPWRSVVSVQVAPRLLGVEGGRGHKETCA